MKRLINIIYMTLLSAALFPISVSAQSTSSIQSEIEALVNGDVLGQAITGICARTGDGKTIVDIDSDNMMVPASNMKLISSGTALHSLGSDYRYQTGIGYDGTIIDGVLMGNLYIIGGGDPTLASEDSIAVPVQNIFSQWTNMIQDAGIKEIDGHVVGSEGDFMAGMAEEPSWMWNDIGTYYGAGVTGLMFYENMQSFDVTAGTAPDAPLTISPSYPETPWMEFRYDCTTGEAGTGDLLYMYTSDLAPVAEIRGTFAVDRKRKRVDCSNKFPELTCAHHFTQWLKEKGISCTLGASDTRLNKVRMPDDVTIIGYTESPELRRIVYETNHISNNLYAETLLRSLGKEMRDEGSYDSSYVAVNEVLEELGVDTSYGIRIQDGSGLSRQNLVSPDFFCRFLLAMMSSPCFEDYAESLPSPGGHGTLSYNMSGYSVETKARIKAKSGSMTGVRCYSGYIIPREGCKDDTIIFSIMVNNCTEPTWKVRPLLDKIMGLLADTN